MNRSKKMLAITAFAGVVFALTAPAMAQGRGHGNNGGNHHHGGHGCNSCDSILVDGDVTQKARTGGRSDIDAIAIGYKSTANVGVASVQLVDPRGNGISIDADVYQRASVDGDITAVARGTRSLANVGVASIQSVRSR